MRTNKIEKKQSVKESKCISKKYSTNEKARNLTAGITLIALVITIIVLLILAGVSIATLTGDNGILTQAGKAKDKTTEATAIEKVQVEVLGSYDDTGKISIELLNDNLENVEGLTSGLPIVVLPATVTVDGYDIIIDANGNVSLKEKFNAEEWDKTASDEDCFIWESDDPNSEGYGIIIGYTAKIENYTKLRYPSRCTKITFSDNLNNNGVTTTTSRAFTNNILKVEIPGTVTSIENYAFGHPNNQSFVSLEKVVIEYGVKTIKNSTFVYCKNLTSITIPNSVTSIGGSAFYGCSSLTSIEIPNSVTSIEGDAFYGCSGLTSIEIPNSVTSIGGSAFYGCSGLTSIKISDSVTSIGSSAFSNCTNLTNIEISDSVTSVGENAFYDTVWYNNQPDGIVYAGKVAYKYKGEMPSNTNIEIKEGTKAIADSAFASCLGLVSIKIPEGVTRIGYNTFYVCISLTSIEIPSSVTSIGGRAFANCRSLTSIEIPEGITSIEGGTFYECSNLTSIGIPNSVTSIGGSAFYGCSSLTSIDIPKGVTSIGLGAFYRCSNLKSIEIPDSITRIESYTFKECTNLKNISISNNVSYIGFEAFAYCTNLLNIVIWKSVDEIGGRTFVGWENTQTINIEANEVPSGWDASWNEDCNANIVYAYTGE